MPVRSSDSRPFEALANPSRRQLLFALWAETPHDHERFDPLELLQVGEPPDEDATKIALEHNHLPKLADMGYLQWERDSGMISTGPAWDDIVPLLEVLADHRAKLPDGLLSNVSLD